MIKNLVIVFATMFSLQMVAQQGTSSPYSFYGLGELKFRGTVENRAMGGISVFSDSIHLNLQNPAGLGKLRLTTFSVGGNQNFNMLKTNTEEANSASTSLDYLAVGLPMKNMAVSFGLMPYSSVGYKTGFTNPFTAEAGSKRFEGSGGVSKVFLAAGYNITKSLSVGADINYNFGKIEQEAFEIIEADIDPYDAREYNKSRLSGLSLKFGMAYQKMLNDKLQLMTGVTYSPEMSLKSENQQLLSSVTWSPSTGLPSYRDTEVVDLGNDAETTYKLPSIFSAGVAISQPKKWMLGIDIAQIGSNDFPATRFRVPVTISSNVNASYTNGSKYAIGGFYIPKYNSLTSYWKRVVYRAGARFEKTGLVVKGKDIEEFGMSFGVGLPVGKMFSNANLMIEYGSRGTKDKDIVRENFINVGVSLSFNDKWFQRRKID
ncbi:outer membrane protein transport protein [Pseudofulvibacter geojedonensis]|uniref:Outer membrane protein transport protein n=1 Tax=Pseudofulvibacter geojedonensis TaxID=1123758 RepID=A0ABW3I386_9FLAO